MINDPIVRGRGLISRLIAHGEQHFEDAGGGGEGHGLNALPEGHAVVDQGCHIHPAGLEGADGLREWAAAGADDGDFVDDERGEVHGLADGDGALEDQVHLNKN